MKDDFNTYHFIWNSEEYICHDEEMNILMKMMMELELKLLFPLGIIIYSNIGIIIDLIWGFNEMVNHLLICWIVKDHDHDSDHLSIEIIIIMQIEESQCYLSYNYTKMNWKKFNKRLESYLSKSINEKVISIDIDNHAKQLIEIIIKMI